MLPRHDFYQTDSHVIVAVYLKGGAGEVTIEPFSVTIAVNGSDYKFAPLFALVRPDQSSYRILSTKIELKLAKATSMQWTSVLSTVSSEAGPSSVIPPPPTSKPNWDKLVETELEEESTSDPNAGGDSALQKMFAQIYAGADEDTKRAMIKSFTESGGTTLSTDWSSIGKERTRVQPPDGMEEKKY